MNNQEIAKYLREIDNSKAAEWLINHYPRKSDNYSDVFHIIPRVSWKKKERKKIARYYLYNLHFSTQKPFLSFLKIMPVRELIDVLNEIKEYRNDFDELAIYHLQNISASKDMNIENRKLINDFLKSLDAK